jgi:hypothetical protein
MTRARLLLATLVAVVAFDPSGAPEAAPSTEAVNVLVPRFGGPDPLGLNVATVLNLQVFRTLRKAPSPNPKHLSFGSGTVIWGEEPLSKGTHDEAERAATGEPHGNVRLVLWGNASEYADGISVEAHLTLPPNKGDGSKGPEIWRLLLPGSGAATELTCDIPARRYTFEPIVLSRDMVANYSSPRALKIFRDRSAKVEVGDLSGGYFRAERHAPDGDWLIEPRRGWLPLPLLGSHPNEVATFTSALLRIMRTDWEGAADELQQVIALPSTPTSVQVDALLYLGLTDEKQGRSGRARFEQARALNPLSQAVARYLVMSAFADYLRAAADSRGPARDRVSALLEESRVLFPNRDPWLEAAARAARSL